MAERHEATRSTSQLQWLRDAPNTGLGVLEALQQLGRLSYIDFPVNYGEQSPAKRPRTPKHDSVHWFRMLFYRHRTTLEEVLLTFLSWISLFEKDQDAKIEYLLSELKNGVARCRTPKVQSCHKLSGLQTDLPASPTLHRKHVPANDGLQAGQLQTLNPTLSSGIHINIFDKTSFALSSSKETSFTTTRNTSFDTVFSEDSENCQSGANAQSPATTVYGSSSLSQNLPADGLDFPLRSLRDRFEANDLTLPPAPASSAAYGSSEIDVDMTRVDKRSGEPAQTDSSSRKRGFAEAFQKTPFTPTVEPGTPSRTGAASRLRRIQNIVTDGLTQIHLPASMNKLPLDLRAETFRLLQCSKLAPAELDREWKGARDFKSLYALAKRRSLNFIEGRPITENKHFLSAKLQWSSSTKHSDPLFSFELQAPRQEMSSPLQSKFGADRFLFVEFDPRLEAPKSLGLLEHATLLKQNFFEMLHHEQTFLGRRWKQMHIKLINKTTEAGTYGSAQLIFFAVEGDGLLSHGILPVVDWAVPLEENGHLLWSKAFARMDLRASRPMASVQLSREDIKIVNDAYATDDVQDHQFDDPELRGSFEDPFDPAVVMTDGCGEADESIFRLVQQEMDLPDPPSAIQIRCGPAKGVLSMRRPKSGDEQDKARIWFTRSQVKVTPRIGIDSEQPILHILKYSKRLKSSFLYNDFMPILVDRHVPEDAIALFAEKQVAQDMQEFLIALDSAGALRDWIFRQFGGRENARREHGTPLLAGFAADSVDMTIAMIQANFEPTAWEPLARLVKQLADFYFVQQSKYFKIQVARSVVALGFVDTIGVLEPGEIQLNFPSPSVDSATGKRWSHLEGPVLVARNPALRPSDIQKVTAVFRPELAHHYDVVIFSKKGRRPLADKCSGGDYDGDTFWICWEDSFVTPFLNAPAPPAPSNLKALGITVDKRRLRDIVHQTRSEDDVRDFVRLGTKNRLQPSLVGQVTKTRERLVYKLNTLNSSVVQELDDLHDLIMDSDKNGRAFSEETWMNFKTKREIHKLPDPAYFKPEANNSATPAKEENILDRVHCCVVQPAIARAREKMKKKLGAASGLDEDLTSLYNEKLNSTTGDKVVHDELTRMRAKLDGVSRLWGELTSKGVPWSIAVTKCRQSFDEIELTDASHPRCIEWLDSYGRRFTTWTLLKASAMAKHFYRGSIWYRITGSELCEMKAAASGKPLRIMTGECYSHLKYKRQRREVIVQAELRKEVLDEFGYPELDIDAFFLDTDE